MIVELQALRCTDLPEYKNSNRVGRFVIAKYIFNYNSSVFDKYLIDKITGHGNKLAESANAGAANDSTALRTANRKLSNAIAGVLAEYCWKNFLNSISTETLVNETSFESAGNQIDLEITGSKKTIEVRSSFPRNGIEFAICNPAHQFDILGPYSNNYKPNEPQKDFYLRTLYHVSTPVAFLDVYKKEGFAVYLTGGATLNMMLDNKYSIDKDLIAEDDFGATEVKSKYRVVPFSKALDCFEIYKLIEKERKAQI